MNEDLKSRRAQLETQLATVRLQMDELATTATDRLIDHLTPWAEARVAELSRHNGHAILQLGAEGAAQLKVMLNLALAEVEANARHILRANHYWPHTQQSAAGRILDEVETPGIRSLPLARELATVFRPIDSLLREAGFREDVSLAERALAELFPAPIREAMAAYEHIHEEQFRPLWAEYVAVTKALEDDRGRELWTGV